MRTRPYLAAFALVLAAVLSLAGCSTKAPPLERTNVISTGKAPAKPADFDEAALAALSDPKNKGATVTLLRQKGGKWRLVSVTPTITK